jgi:hypothetical protein
MGDRAVVKADIGAKRPIQIEVQTAGDPEALVSIRKVLSFDGVVDSIQAISERMTKALETVAPDKAAVEFGVDIGLESGALTALIAKGTGSATLKITLEWEPGSATRLKAIEPSAGG